MDPGTLLVLVVVGVLIYSLIDAIVTDAAAVRHLPKWAWIAIIVLIPFGSFIWLFAGRPKRSVDAPSERPGGGFIARTPRPQTPRRTRPTRAERASEEAELQARIAERDRLMAQWAEEDRRKSGN